VPFDQISTPTYAPELAQSAIRLSTTDLQGVVNILGSDCLSRYEFALQAARVFQLPEKLIQPVTTKELHQPAERPLMAGLKTDKAVALLGGIFSSSSEGLKAMSMQKH
jgi:dTDP-4-dehydrorhamnose reductase